MENKIGLSLPFGLFTGVSSGGASEYIDAFGGVDAFLDFCGDNLDSVELRTVSSAAYSDTVLGAVKSLKERGLTVTLHGKLCEAEEFFTPYLRLFSEGLEDSYTITVHPVGGFENTERLLRDICAMIDAEGYPVTVALENQRMKESQSFGTCAEVEEIVARIDSPHLSICFDFGHQLTNERRGLESAPTDGFLSRVCHTHIHALCERTHFPLSAGECLLDRNVTELLSLGYGGVLNLELSPERYGDRIDVGASLRDSISMLKAAALQVQAKLDTLHFYKNEYLNTIKCARARFDGSGNCALLVGHAGYLLKLDGVRIAVDIAPGIMPIDNEAKVFLREWISEFDAIIATHSHGDHYDREFISSLPDSVKKLIPDFIPLEVGGRVKLHNGSSLKLGNIDLTFFEGAHLFEGNGVPELGFAVGRGEDTYVFPADARDYDFAYPHFDNVKILFAHLWLGRALALRGYEQFVDRFCRFIESFGAERCYVAHMRETSRNVENMWSDIHLDAVRKILPDVEEAKIGEIIVL